MAGVKSAHGAAIVGSGPNGLAAAVTLARAGIPVTVFEAADRIGGGARTLERVTPGVLHDVCSAIHPMALATEFFREFELERRVRFAVPDASYAQPLDGAAGPWAAVAYRDLDRTAQELGRDGAAYARLYRPLLARLDGVQDAALGGAPLRIPADPLGAIALGARALEQGSGALWNRRFREEAAPALLAGVAAHAVGRLPGLAPAGVAAVIGAMGHARGWPVPIGGSRAITNALAADLIDHGGRFETGWTIRDIGELDGFRVKLFDTSAPALARIAGGALPRGYARRLESFRFGDGAAKVDFVLDAPIPWADPRVAEAPTVHLGGTRAEVAAAENAVARGIHPERPFVLLAQPTEFDPGRNPAGVNAVWSYTHVPAGSDRDVSGAVIAQIERFAPGFRDLIRDFRVTTAAELGEYNANYAGGDISAGAISLRQILARPTLARDPWRTPVQGLYLCSSATAPGPGVHGLPGWYAAKSALRNEFGMGAPALGITG
ncbi:NAD(P)/FAD-dependent oxidoreductase [Leucobacter sp. CSA2]|uniref:NAD(P)/FAD-dependent oxidoreductase n=1 Tax=Leucobacter edaphi TaxID=2796472 RepID=A0A934QFC3_9MICO|nr:NAD(P)/FAD-dependent oxidoreductase [Leucobacter edaphi]MBK0422332.1 NAD(P)/FAD-dependent oxidoreductase [Leucobacter edaphi]